MLSLVLFFIAPLFSLSAHFYNAIYAILNMEQSEVEEWISRLEKPFGDFMYYELDINREDQWRVWSTIYTPIGVCFLFWLMRTAYYFTLEEEAAFDNMLSWMADGLSRIASFVWAPFKGVFWVLTRITKVLYDRWCRGPGKSIRNRMIEAMAVLPAPEPGYVPGGFQQDVNAGEFLALVNLRAIDRKAREETERVNAKLVRELAVLRATVCESEQKLEDMEKQVGEANRRAKVAEDNQVFYMHTIVPGNRKARPGRPPFEEWPFPPSSRPETGEVVTPTVLGRLQVLRRELKDREAEVVDLTKELAEVRKSAVVPVAVAVSMAPVVVDTTEVGVQTDDLPLPEKEVEVSAAPVYADEEVQTDLPLQEVVSPVVVAEKATQSVDTTDAGVQTDLAVVASPPPASPIAVAAAPVPSPVAYVDAATATTADAATVPLSDYQELVEKVRILEETRDAEVEVEEEVRPLKADKDELVLQIQSMTGELATAQNAISTIGQELTESRARFSSLEFAYNQTVGTLGACDQARQAAVARANELQTANDQGNAELARQREAVAALQPRLEAASHGHAQQEERFQTGCAQFEASQAQLAELQKRHDEEAAEKAARTQELGNLVAAGRRLEAENRALKVKVDALEWSGKKLAKEMRDAQAASASRDEEIRRLREQGPGQTGAVEEASSAATKSSTATTTTTTTTAATPHPQTPAGKQAVGKLGESPLMRASTPRQPRASPGVIDTYKHVVDDLTRKNRKLAEEKEAAEAAAKVLRDARDGLEVELALLKELHEEDEQEARASMRAQLDKHRAEMGEMDWQLRNKEIDLALASSKMEVARIQFEAEKKAVDELRGRMGGAGAGAGADERQEGQGSPRKGKRVASQSDLAFKEAKKPMTEEDRGQVEERDAQWADPAGTGSGLAMVVAKAEDEEEVVSEEE